MSTDPWRPFGLQNKDFPVADATGLRVINLTPGRDPADAGSRWLSGAIVGVGVLTAASAAVSIAAQYTFVWTAKHSAWVAGLEAGIPDVGSLIFACLGIALALQGKRAMRARMLNLACVGLSLLMNALAAKHGWRDTAAWIMPSAVYALASDTLIGVVRTLVLAKRQELADAPAEPTLLTIAARFLFWLLRLCVAPPSTLKGLRAWVLEYCPVAPGLTPAAIEAAQSAAAAAATAAAAAADERVAQAEAGQARGIEAARTEAADRVAAADRARDDANRQVADATAQAQAKAQQAHHFQQMADAAQAEAQRAREMAAQIMTQAQDNSAQERREFQASLAGLRETVERLDAELRAVTSDRDRLSASLAARPAQPALPAGQQNTGRQPGKRGESKTARFLALVQERYGELASIDLTKVSRISAELAPDVGLDPGAGRSALRPLVRAAQGGAS